MPDLVSPIPQSVEPSNIALSTPPAVEVNDYITPPAKKVFTVQVNYLAAKKGQPMPYELPEEDDQP